MARLAFCTAAEVEQDRIGKSAAYAVAHRCCVLLKGPHSLAAGPRGDVFMNPTGGPVLATAGTGDVLAGAIGGLLAQGLEALSAARLGAYLHGLAGDRWAEAHGELGLRAWELADGLPQALKGLAA
jgi:NAD(P)H-hydrate epimerase